MAHSVTEYIEYVVKSLVDDPDQVVVEEDFDGDDIVLELDAAKDERGRVIGKHGRVIRSMRVVSRAAAGRDGYRVRLDMKPLPGEEDKKAAGKGTHRRSNRSRNDEEE